MARVRDMVEIETASFWRDSPEVERGELFAREHRNGNLFVPCSWYRGKGWDVHQYNSAYCNIGI